MHKLQANPRHNPIRTAYFIRIPNVGDLATPSIVTALSGRETIHTNRRDLPHLLAAGSIMTSSTAHSLIWGTGVMHPTLGVGSPDPINIHALRGRLSYSAIRKAGLSLGDIPLGDPGYLLPNLLGIERAKEPKFQVGVVAHYVDRSNPIIRKILSEEGVVDLDVHRSPLLFLRQMAECETVVSTSLHGLIFAEALGIPNLWIKVSNEIAGGLFKFRDWFSTTLQPQASPHLLEPTDSVVELCDRAELHECKIDVKALVDAFPHQHLERIEVPINQSFFSVSECRARPLPVFLISFNRGSMLKHVINAIQLQSRPTEIIIHDNGSTEANTLQILSELEADGIKVFRHSPINCANDLNLVNETVQSFFSTWAEPSRYVVSDCDIDMSIADPLALDVYDALLNQFRKVNCVGPMLRIQDIPKTYPLYNRVMNRHIQQFWRRVPRIEHTSFGPVALINAKIDTTFALHRAGEDFRRLKSGIRVYEPFEARHLDWYKTDLSGIYTETSSSAISHWDNKAEFATHQDAALEHFEFYIVRKSHDGNLEIHQESLQHLAAVDSPAHEVSNEELIPDPIEHGSRRHRYRLLHWLLRIRRYIKLN